MSNMENKYIPVDQIEITGNLEKRVMFKNPIPAYATALTGAAMFLLKNTTTTVIGILLIICALCYIFLVKDRNTVDVYEGAFFHTRGVFRSEPTSCMHNNIPYYNAISREAMVKRIKKYAGETYSFEDFKANDKEALPSVVTKSGMLLDYNTGASSPFDQRPPKFMGEKPSFKKSDF